MSLLWRILLSFRWPLQIKELFQQLFFFIWCIIILYHLIFNINSTRIHVLSHCDTPVFYYKYKLFERVILFGGRLRFQIWRHDMINFVCNAFFPKKVITSIRRKHSTNQETAYFIQKKGRFQRWQCWSD